MKYRVQELEETFDYLIDMEFAILDDIEQNANYGRLRDHFDDFLDTEYGRIHIIESDFSASQIYEMLSPYKYHTDLMLFIEDELDKFVNNEIENADEDTTWFFYRYSIDCIAEDI